VIDNPRIEELRRRIQKDPASIAFAQLAEEYRRIGDHLEAIRVCQAGLDQHPAYLSARVTLGRSLLELGRVEEAEAEFQRVLE
jgi:tetratricopeptide (TPR) repeat protein